MMQRGYKKKKKEKNYKNSKLKISNKISLTVGF